MLFQVLGRTRDGQRVLAVRGELDVATVPELAAAIEAELVPATTSLGLDLTATSFLDSSGARGLLVAARRAEQLGCRLFLICPVRNTAVRRVLTLLRLDTVLSVVDSLSAPAPIAHLPTS